MFTPTASPSKVRSLLGAAIGQFFAHERFVEVETAALQVSGGNERIFLRSEWI